MDEFCIQCFWCFRVEQNECSECIPGGTSLPSCVFKCVLVSTRT